MKKKLTYLILTVLCLGIFLLYLKMDQLANDTVAPKIQIEEYPLEVFVSDPESYLFQGVYASDDRDGDVTDTMVIENITLSGDNGQATVVYAAFDQAGNVSKARREIRYIDYVEPHFELKQALVFTENTNFDVLSLVTAEDYRDGNITHWVRATAMVGDNLNTVGIHPVQFRVTNSLGDTAILELPVEVYSAGTFHGTLKLREYVAYLKVGDIFDETDYPLSYTLGNKTLEFNRKLPDQFKLQVHDNVDTQTPGLYEVNYTLTYEENGYSYLGYSKLFVVVEE